MRIWLGITVIAALLGFSIAAQAHFPNLSDGSHDGPESAFAVEDPAVSMVLYHEVTCDALQLWLTFEAEEGFPLIAELAVPVLDRLADYRPSLALVSPGLPAPDRELPFALPEGAGVEVWDTAGEEPEEFYEPFTGTSSWVLASLRDWPLPETGRYWLVAWSPTRETGKLWVVIGIEEDFSGITSAAEFNALLDGVKAFHEVEGEKDVTEEVCPPDDDPDGTGDDDGDGHDHGDDHDHDHGDDHDHDHGDVSPGGDGGAPADVGAAPGAAATGGGGDDAGSGGCAAAPATASVGAPWGAGALLLFLALLVAFWRWEPRRQPARVRVRARRR